MKFAVYAFLSPLIVAGIVIGCLGLIVRGACSGFQMGYNLPEVIELKREQRKSKAPAYHHGMDD